MSKAITFDNPVILSDGVTVQEELNELSHIGRSITASINNTIINTSGDFSIAYNAYLNDANKKDFDGNLAEILLDGTVRIKTAGRYLLLTETTLGMQAITAYGAIVIVRVNSTVLVQSICTPKWSNAMSTQTASTCVLKEGDIISVGGNVHNDICDVGRAILELVYLGQ